MSVCCGLTVTCREGRRDPQEAPQEWPVLADRMSKGPGDLSRAPRSSLCGDAAVSVTAALLHFSSSPRTRSHRQLPPLTSTLGLVPSAPPECDPAPFPWPCSTRPARSGFLALRLWLLPVLSRSPGGLTQPPAAPGLLRRRPLKFRQLLETRVLWPEGALSKERQGGQRGRSQPPRPFTQKLPSSVSLQRGEGGCTSWGTRCAVLFPTRRAFLAPTCACDARGSHSSQAPSSTPLRRGVSQWGPWFHEFGNNRRKAL